MTGLQSSMLAAFGFEPATSPDPGGELEPEVLRLIEALARAHVDLDYAAALDAREDA